jgi:hypothetical protein
MGSSSGGYYNWSARILPAHLKRIEDECDQDSSYRAHDAAVNSFLQGVQRDVNARDTDAVARHLDDLMAAIGQDVDGQLKMLFGGSVRKHTHVDGLSDIDTLVILNDTALAGLSPRDVLELFAEKIRQRRPATVVNVGELAITVRYSNGIEIQLLPAIKTARGVRIKLPFEDCWSQVVRPQAFARKLTEVNQACGNKVVPTIKLYKALQSNLPEAAQLKGYHIESLAIEAFKSYEGSYSAKEMLLHLCDVAARRVLSPIPDRTGQSLHVDDYLGAADSVQRNQVARAIDDLTRRLCKADGERDLDGWIDEFGGD